MRGINSLFCPKCGYEFPLFPRGSQTIRTSLFLSPWLRCPKCETLSHMRISWLDAVWAWPITLILLLGLISCRRSGVFGHAPIGSALYGCVAGLIIGLGIRRGMRMVSLSGESLEQAQAGLRLRGLVALLLLCIFLLIFAAITKRWINTLLSLCIGFGVAAFYYFLVWSKPKGNAGPESK